MVQEIQLRKQNRVKELPCPRCGKMMQYEDSNNILVCKDEDCRIGFNFSRGPNKYINMWWRYEGGSESRQSNLKFVKEAMRRIDLGNHLANNLTIRPRGKSTLKESEIDNYCKDNDITKKIFFEIKKIDRQIRSDDWIAEQYGLDYYLVQEINRIKIRR